MRLFLGVDGGQSSTTVLIGDESGRVLGAGEAGPCNHAGAEEGRARFEISPDTQTEGKPASTRSLICAESSPTESGRGVSGVSSNKSI